ncbi:hypothetical protein SAMN05216272_10385 [Pseudomonas panipatensis]|uniref:Uncharacterized protein n=2 Tax=Pseudomonas panipatensis TaxID=428992 RepID=A0A1G8F8D5_9PSED|nr:hypothetical protein SAMN05216272_10385 [Pseudomonas panipatensis]SMP54989.1 hypothetical protein SAMN06295951_103374 [Pseudomonas panipatensis]
METLGHLPSSAAPHMHRPTSRYLRDGALASIGLYSVVILVLLALTGGFNDARQVPDDPVDQASLFHRFNDMVPSALVLLQQSLRPHS